MNTPQKITVGFTFNELSELVNELTQKRDMEQYRLPYRDSDEKHFVDDEGWIKDYSVRSAETALTDRARLARMIGVVTGEQPTEDPTIVARVLDARRLLDEQEARKAEQQEATNA